MRANVMGWSSRPAPFGVVGSRADSPAAISEHVSDLILRQPDDARDAEGDEE